jgi:hypothetical protein
MMPIRVRWWVTILVLPIFVLCAAYGVHTFSSSPSAAQAQDGARPMPAKTWEFAAFEQRLLKHRDLEYDDLASKIGGARKYVEQLSFDPTEAEFYDRVKDKLALKDAEIATFQKNGFVSIDLNARHCMVSAYNEIYMKDLPVLVTTDSILHALHRSFDDILMQMEMGELSADLSLVLDGCQRELKKVHDAKPPAGLNDNLKDVELFLTVPCHLLHGAAAKGDASIWDGTLFLGKTHTGVDAQALDLLKKVEGNEMDKLAIYGGERIIDFTQFKPRGHYTKNDNLRRYFRAMMWLGRADTGWITLPPDPRTRVVVDSERELRNAMLLVHLLERSGTLATLKRMDDAVNFFVGRSDNLSVFQLRDLMADLKINTLTGIAAADSAKRMQQAILTNKHHRPMIVSMVLYSDGGPSPQVPAPALFQLFGQRFAIDSFVLSQVVFDTIVYKGGKMERRIPSGLDVMVALGNGAALPLLQPELEKWKYSANLLACREFVDGVAPAFWRDSLYNIWLDGLRVFNADRTGEPHFPQAMKTAGWQRKELQTQLASWAELRHDTVLYVKQSYGRASCEYPAGYVEPYPEFYAKIKRFSDEAQKFFANDERRQSFFKNFSDTMAKLEGLARKELRAEAFTKEETEFVKKTLTSERNCDGTPISFNGWYCRLYYNPNDFELWEPTITDVHTDPMLQQCVQVGVGETNLCAIAIDNQQHRRVYVGPIYSYYEFTHAVTDRMTDEAWKDRLQKGDTPARPNWVREFQAERRPVPKTPTGQ